MISFVSHGDKTLQRLIGMPGEQEHHISSIPFFFFITYKILTCERRLYLPFHNLQKHHKICNITLWNSGQILLSQISGIKLIVFSVFFHQLLMAAAFNDAPLL